MTTSRKIYNFAEIAVAVALMLATFINGAPTVAAPSEDTVADSYTTLYQKTVAFYSEHQEIYKKFKSIRLDNEDIMDDIHSFNFEGLPTPVSRFLAFRMEEKDLLVLHRDNFQAFLSFVQIMYMEELDHEAEGLSDPFHEEFQEIRHHLNIVINNLNSLLHALGYPDSVDTSEDPAGASMLNSVHIRDIRHVKVLYELSNYLPSARQHFEHLGKSSTI